MKRLLPILMVLIPYGWSDVSAQSLGEVARKERARRAAIEAQKSQASNQPVLKQRRPNPPELTSLSASLSPRLPPMAASSGESGDSTGQEPSVDELEARAAAAVEAGDYSEAVSLYEQVLLAEPNNVRALYLLARYLSWEKRFRESVQVYEEILVVIPGNQRAALEKGNVLLWDQQYGAAAKVFEDLLRSDPDIREARLGLARSLAASGKLGDARGEFAELIRQNRHDAEAMVGIAQTYHWTGANDIARDWYERALGIEPGRWEAEVGLGYLDLWSDPAASQKRAASLERRYPGQPEVMKLREESQKAISPSISLSHDQLSDSHTNELNTTRVEADFGLSPTMDLSVGAGRYGMRYDGDFGGSQGSGSITSAYTVLGMPTGPGQKLRFRIGVDRLESTTGALDYTAVGGVAWDWGKGRRWQGVFSVQRDPFRYTTTSLDEGIIVTAFTASVARRVGERWSLDGEVGGWRVTDKSGRNNRRFSTQAGIRYQWSVKDTLPIQVGYGFQYFSYEDNWGASFFSPSYYRSHQALFRTDKTLGSRFDFHVLLGAGVQSYDGIANEPMFVGTGVLGFRLGSGYKLELFGTRGDYLLMSALPVTSEQLGLRLLWKGGNR